MGRCLHLCLDAFTLGPGAVSQTLTDIFTLPAHGPVAQRVLRQLARWNAFILRYSGVVLYYYLVQPFLLLSYFYEDMYLCSATDTVVSTAVVLLISVAFCVMVHLTAHRYFAHNSYSAPRAVQLLLGVVGAAAGQNGPLEWASVHARHHRHCDEVRDPHSPMQRGLFEAHVLWLVRPENCLIEPNQLRANIVACPELVLCDVFSIELHAFLLLSLGSLLARLLPVCLHADLIIQLAWVISLHSTSLTNSLCHSRRHFTGSQGHKSPAECDALDLHWVALLNGGEGLHRYHHSNPRCAHHGFRSGGIDLVYACICIMERIGLVSRVCHAATRDTDASASFMFEKVVGHHVDKERSRKDDDLNDDAEKKKKA